MIPLINGEAYSWGQIVLNIFNTPIAGITAIEYEEKQEMTNNFGAGNYPVTQGVGKVEATCKLTVMMEEVEGLVNAAPLRRLQNIPVFDIGVSYIHPATAKIVTHKIMNCRFMNNPRSTKSGDTMIECQLELLCTHIKY